jgi:hypothetical protein
MNPSETGRCASRAPVRLDGMNRAPRWLLPSVLAILVLAVVVGAIVH